MLTIELLDKKSKARKWSSVVPLCCVLCLEKRTIERGEDCRQLHFHREQDGLLDSNGKLCLLDVLFGENHKGWLRTLVGEASLTLEEEYFQRNADCPCSTST